MESRGKLHFLAQQLNVNQGEDLPVKFSFLKVYRNNIIYFSSCSRVLSHQNANDNTQYTVTMYMCVAMYCITY